MNRSNNIFNHDIMLFIDALEEMNIETIKKIVLENNPDFSQELRYNIFCLKEGLNVMHSLGNNRLKFSKKFFRIFTYSCPIDEKIIDYYRCKFTGNKTRQHLSLFVEVYKNRICSFYDVTDVKKAKGCIPIDNLQVLAIPIGEDLNSQLSFLGL